jgi:hypothetical protein
VSFTLAVKYLAWAAVVVVAMWRPALGASGFRRLGALTDKLARHRTATWLGLGLLVLLVRGALLPLWPIPKPVIYDEFSYLLQADTFAHGRLTNPTHKLWPFFESAYVLQHPTYASKYPPAQSLAMAAGRALLGDPWFGVWLSCGAMMAAMVWAMQGWLPPRWALLGGLLAMPVTTVSYWMNSYWGGAVAALGGALLLGGYVRVVRRKQVGYAVAMGIGIAILANTRPYEGLVFSIPVAIAFLLSRPVWKAEGKAEGKALALVTAVLIPAFAATGYYNRAVTGSALRLPFIEYASQYVYIPLFNFQPLQPTKVYRTTVIYDLHQNWEREQWEKARSWQLVPIRLADWKKAASTVLGSVALGLLIVLFLPNLWRDRRIRLPLACVAAALAGSVLEVCYYPHYAGPATAALLIVTVQALRHLRQWKPGGALAGRWLARALPVLVVGSAMASQAVIILRQIPPENLQPVNARRNEVAAKLSEQGGKHVILVHYTKANSPHEEWVYNSSDIDGQDVIWAHDLGVVDNAPLLEYYKDRKIWRFQPDIDYTFMEPYTGGQ